ncbi:MAG: hypothetical protein QOE45_816 [Frankiaceae bacterium]|jgi:hypothetical protein|nr:hypothetical protein [Frankiaceae bacterium]
MRFRIVVAAALLVAGAPVLAHGAPRPATSKAEARAAWVAARARAAHRLPVDPALLDAPVPVDSFDSAYLLRAGDLDGDHVMDLVDVRDHVVFDDVTGPAETLRLEAHRGRDGKALWSLTLPTAYFVFPVFTTVGAKGANGFLALSFSAPGGDTDVAGGAALVSDVTSYDAAGKSLWTSKSPGLAVGTLVSYQDVGYPAVGGIGNLVAGGGADLLMLSYVTAAASDPAGTTEQTRMRMQLGVLDGATGVTSPLGQGFTSDSGFAYATTVGDLNNDKRDDVAAVVTASGAYAVSLVNTADGAVLGTPTGLPKGDILDVYEVDDVTGDGIADVVAAAQSFGFVFASSGEAPSPAQPPATVALIDGAKRKVAWSRPAGRVFEVGDVDRKRGGELVLGSDTSDGAGFTVAAYNGAGKALWTATRRVKTADLNRYDISSSWGSIGDAQGDGVADIGYGIVVAPYGAKIRRDEGTLDGRTGRMWRDPAPDLAASRIALDGRGIDAIGKTYAKGVLTLTAWRGNAPQRLWRTALAATGMGYLSVGALLDGDKCGDIVVNTATETSETSYVLSGSTGLPMWGLTRNGNAAGAVTHPTARSHARYIHTC